MWMRVSLNDEYVTKLNLKTKIFNRKTTSQNVFNFHLFFCRENAEFHFWTQRSSSHTLREVLRSYFYVLLFQFLQFLPSILISFFRSTWFGVLPQRRDTFTSAINEEITELTRRRRRDENVALMELPIN